MEKLLIGIAFIVFNVGSYLLFVLNNKIEIPKKIRFLFYLYFGAVILFWWLSKNPQLDDVQLSIYLVLSYLLVWFAFRFIFSINNEKHREIVVRFFKLILLPVLTLFVTVAQLSHLF